LRKKTAKFIVLFCLFAAGLFADLWTKKLAVDNLQGNPTLTVIEGVLEFTYTENRGMIFGLLNDRPSPLKHYGLTVLTIVSICFLLFVIWRLRDKPFYIDFPLILILSGAIANLIDRIHDGHVVDFIHISWKSTLDWPFLFNGADALITVGEIILLVLIIFKGKELEKAVFKR
jgi:signal peptidase II